ncbi:unnamed protein product [Sympodiomycopsis kandeliae]
MQRFFKKKGASPAPAGEQGALPGVATPGAASLNSPSLFAGNEGSMLAGYGPNTCTSSVSDASSSLQRQTAYEIMAETLFRYAQRERLFSDNTAVWNGVALRLAKGKYVCSPQHDPRLLPWISSLAILNCDAVVCITSTVVAGITSTLPEGCEEVALSTEDRVQVVERVEELATARKAQGAAFIRTENRLCVWSDKVEDLMTVARAIEGKMVKYVWERATGTNAPAAAVTGAPPVHITSSDDEKTSGLAHDATEGVRWGAGGEKIVTTRILDEKNPEDPEALVSYQERHTNLQAPLLHGLGNALNVVVCSLVIRKVLTESFIDGQWTRAAIIAATPFMYLIALFFCDNIIQGIALLFGPIRQMSLNSRYYSGVKPERMTGTLPHVTIQMPVYKEPLDSVLAPTIESLNKAIQTYELQGGTASILVSEDGMLLVDQQEREKRIEYYDRNNIAWVARPPHNTDGYIRKGRFKKASNLNFTCALSLAVEKKLDEERPTSGPEYENWSLADENALYESALQRSLAEAHPLAEATGNIRIGDLILIIDCDTRVPEDCFLDAASEMTQCPDVAILQHCSGVMLVTKNNYFEKGIAFFTRYVNFAISYTVSIGDAAPFMGHNAYLRWSAVQEAAAVDPEDGIRKIWSESTVSEDFEISLRLLMKGYIVRWATYSNEEYKEGVSLTADDELNRWQKYAFGVSELLIHPFWKWFHKGPITPLYRSFLWAKQVPLHAKFSSCSYMFSYYAIASALPLTVALTIAQGLFAPSLDGAFLPPFNVFVAVVVVFSGLGNIATIVAKFRSRRYTFWTALKEHVIWLPFLVVFFSGLSYHVLTALLAHPFGYNMSWGSTNKDLEDSNFFIEVPQIIKKYWKMLIFCIVILAGFAVLNGDVLPIEWQLHGGFYVLWCPLLLASMHILYLIALNPQLLRFSF